MIDRRRFVSLGGMAASAILTSKFDKAFADSEPATAGATVTTTAGKVQGVKLGKVQAFKGVPYGASTAPPNRFMPPRKPKPWTNVRDASKLGSRSPQLLSDFHGFVPPEVEAMDRDEPLSEDCLMLNVWTPGVGPAGKRPVMVWLHGGGYTSGSGGFICYDGANLAGKHDVVAVTVNHRLSVFGYTYLAGLGGEKYADSGNVGNLDIVAALEWVRDNIAAFGGDPANVTLFGQSGGAGKVSCLLAMPKAKGLFHRAIVQSGAAIRGTPKEAASKTAEEVLKRVSLTPKDVDKLQGLSMEQLLATTERAKGPPLNFGPVVDGGALPGDPFDPTAPAQSADIPLLIGTTETEVTFFPGQILDPIDDAKLHASVKGIVRKATDAQVDQLIAAYRAGRPKDSNTDLFLIIASDATFRAGVLVEADRKAQQAKAAVYQYYFTWRSPVREGKLRSFHTLEIPFVFDVVEASQSMTGGKGKGQQALADRMSAAWVAFARTGNPNHPGLPKWGTFDTKQRTTMVFDSECKVVNDPHGEEQRLLHTIQGA